MSKPRLFIGSSTLGLTIAEEIKTELTTVADCIIWNDDSFFGLGAATFESLYNSLEKFDFAILIFTADDPIIHNDLQKFKPRDNVLIEYGLFAGALGRDRAFVVAPLHEPLHIPTDLAGISVAHLERSSDTEKKFDVSKCCIRIAKTIQSKWHRHSLHKELGVLYRLLNAFTFPYYHDIHVPAILKANINYRLPQEQFNTVEDVVSFLSELLTDYIYPQLNLVQLQSMRIYFAYYIGDGFYKESGNIIKSCLDLDSNDKPFQGEFVIGLANPTPTATEQNWRIGRAIKGFSGVISDSLCAKVFDSGQRDGFEDLSKLPRGAPNYDTPGEASVYSFPVEWRSENGYARIGVLTVSSKAPNSVTPELRILLDLLANILGFVFSLYAVNDKELLRKTGQHQLFEKAQTRGLTGVDGNNDSGQFFTTEVIGLRRLIASHFEARMLSDGYHVESTEGIITDVVSKTL